VRIPFWIVSNLGKTVQLSKPHHDGLRIWPAGSLCRLESIQAGGGVAFATVVLDDGEENLPFGCLRPA
jgi:hypothetical protein